MLSTFEDCPLKWYDRYILKNKEPETESTRYGKYVHGSIEDYINGKRELPEDLQRNKALVDSVKSQFRDQSKVELKMGVTKELSPAEFFGNDVWGRCAADVALIHNDSNHAFIGDWKTGKKFEKEDQLKIGAMMLFKHFDSLQSVSGCNLWLKYNKMGEVYTFERTKETQYWVDLLKRLDKMYKAVGTPAAVETRPGFMCNYCPVKNCKFNKS
jgi:hypothetical protein